MSCSACSKRRQGRIIPVTPAKQPAERKGNPNGAVAQGSTLRSKLRYTGR